MNTETSPMTAAGLNLPRDLTRRDWLKLCALLLALISAPAAPMLAATDDEIPVVDPFFMLSGALLKDGFDGPQLDATLWSRPSWLVENHKTIGVTIENGHLVIAGPSHPERHDHQYSGVLSKYFRDTDVVLAAEVQARSPFEPKGRIQHMVHLCSGDYPDFFTEIIFGKIAGVEPPRWYTAYLAKVWQYSGYREYLDPLRPATGSEGTLWHTVVLTHDGTTSKTRNYLVLDGKWIPIGPSHSVRFNHTHIELKVDVNVPDVPVQMAVDNVRLYPNPAHNPVTIVVYTGVSGNKPKLPIHDLKVRIFEAGSSRLLGEALTDEGGEARVSVRADVVYPVAAAITVSDGTTPVVQSKIQCKDVNGLYPGDVWALDLRHKRVVNGIDAADASETLYNGIVLPREWPPRLADFPTSVEKDPVTPPYLLSPPAVISIDVGRQLFVDDFLVGDTTLKRTFHLPKYHQASPVLKPDKPWEMKNPDHAAAMVFSDGVWYDPKDQLFKMWYLAGESAATGYATSRDGIHWEKPLLDVRPPTNIVQPGGRDSSTVWLDLEEKDPARRFKMFRVIGAGEDPVTKWNNWQMAIHFSADGIHWGEPVAKTGRVVDRSTVFWNPFRQVWVYSIRHVYKVGDDVDKPYGFARRRSYVEGPDILAAARWEVNEPLRWTDVDRLDPQRDDLKIKPQLYNLDAVAYESLMVGFFTVWRGQPADRHKPNNVVLGYSRDGWHWSRPDRRAFCPVSDKQGDWNANNVQSAGGGFLVVGDELYFYVSGRSGRPGGNKAGTLTTGLATLRRDGFASMDADEAGGTLTTRPVRFRGRHLFVNVEDPNGEMRVEILSQAGEVVPRFTVKDCAPVTADKTLHLVRWTGVEDLSSLANQPVRFRFHLKNGRLFAFWVSPEKTGASHGYVAAGGPGFSSNRDLGGSAGQIQ